MPGMSSLDVLKAVRPSSKVPVIAFSEGPENQAPAIRAGANFLLINLSTRMRWLKKSVISQGKAKDSRSICCPYRRYKKTPDSSFAAVISSF